jgi:BolA protein
MAMRDRIETRLREVFRPDFIEVIDESERHIGHAGYQEGGESHFRVTLRSARFEGMSRLERHRAVHAALGPEIVGAIHALALNLDL